ncbi:cell wall-binding repeat-containing protein [Bifidobacterium panos]|uniref:Internalin A n=1 Tax=Bifidobacterium panos TaxID=2675321 RepID=A0ABX1SUP1_9BIFI|nr:cell wall-binding repeat-containing protein [Bifidobacterium sp. DSM 109963]NMN01535.1 internalin A [Bifidobacterium sp. DSM 109963]
MMRSVATKARPVRRGALARLLAGLLAMALMAVLCPAGAIPAQAAGTDPTLRVATDRDGRPREGVILGSGIDKAKVRTITLKNSKPTGTKCWDAGRPEGSVTGCATASAEASGMYDVVYGADGVYPKFPIESDRLFSGLASRFSGLVSIKGLDRIDTSNVYNMEAMFAGCSSLTGLDLSNWNTSNVTNMYSMFQGCSSLTGLDLSNWNTSKVRGSTNTLYMFEGVSKLVELRLGAGVTLSLSDCGLGSPDASASRAGYVNVSPLWRDASSGVEYATANIPSKRAGTYTAFRPASEAGRLTRLSGDTRYDTMGKVVSQAYPDTAGTVIVASGANYPDALSASGLSGVLDAPIVLTDPNALSSQAVAQIKRLNPFKVIIVGGVNAVSGNVESQLKSYVRTVERQGGETRYDTSYLLYELGGWRGRGDYDTAIVASGAGYADALSVSSYAYASEVPVFLCDPDAGLTAAQRTALARFERVIVVGGVNAVPDRHVSGLPGVIRLAGQTRYETSVALAKWTQSNGLGMNGVVYARGDDYPDALVSGPLAGRNKAPVLLVSDAKGPAVSYSKGFKGKVSTAYVVGGSAAVSAATANALADALGVRRP